MVKPIDTITTEEKKKEAKFFCPYIRGKIWFVCYHPDFLKVLPSSGREYCGYEDWERCILNNDKKDLSNYDVAEKIDKIIKERHDVFTEYESRIDASEFSKRGIMLWNVEYILGLQKAKELLKIG